MNEANVLLIHHAIHDLTVDNVVINNDTYPIQTNSDEVRYAIVMGHKFMVSII